MFVPVRFVLIKKLDPLPFQLTEAEINSKKKEKKSILKINSNSKKGKKSKNLYSVAVEKRGGKKLAYSLHGNRAVGLITVSTPVVIGRFFQRAPFIVQITSGTFVPSDKWQLIIYPDSAETTHSSKRCACARTRHSYWTCECAPVRAAKVHLRVCERAPVFTSG